MKGHKDIVEMFIKEDSSAVQLDSNGDNALSAAIVNGSRNTTTYNTSPIHINVLCCLNKRGQRLRGLGQGSCNLSPHLYEQESKKNNDIKY